MSEQPVEPSAEQEEILALLDEAEEALYSQEDPAECIDLCNAGLDKVEDEELFVQLIVLKAEAQLTAELDGMAVSTLQELDSCSIDEPLLLCDVADMWFHVGDEQRAGELYTEALELDDELADAHYGLGLVLDTIGDRDGMVAQWKRVRELDAAAPHAEVHVSGDELQRIAEEALAELPPQVIELLRNVPILIEDLPSAELVAEGADPRMLGLFDGHSMLEQDTTGGQPPALTTIHIYQRNIERGADDEHDLAEEIRITVLHETAHYFGLDDDALDELGLG